ncbi:hypothetical protein J3Q64DRAFT_1743403 [Phycomyces blakesleeanus]|uniref:Telomere-associated protein Rif1 N-terminal domain-containing protein n=1 Tax=Phycomyces blakesleeanus TaxID=4837 RepID=A0ABR3AY55_PHYBL
MIILSEENAADHDLLTEINPNHRAKESTVIHSTHPQKPNLPLGKAMHLLLNVKPQVFQLAVQKLNKNPSETSTESPVASALLSLEDHISIGLQRFSGVAEPALSPVYNALKEKFLKRSTITAKNESDSAMRLARFLLLESRHRLVFCSLLENELKSTDRRSQLATVLLLDSVVQTWPDIDTVSDINPGLIYSIQVVADMSSNLTRVASASGSQPTLLACTAWDLVWTCSRYVAATLTSSLDQTKSSGSTQLPKIVLIESTFMIDKKKKDTMDTLWKYNESLVSTIRMWHTTMYFTQHLAWHQVLLFLSKAHTLILREDPDSVLVQMAKTWVLMTSALNTKNILSVKPLSQKKKAAILSLKKSGVEAHIEDYAKMVSLVAVQKGLWKNKLGIQTNPVPFSDEEKEEEKQIKAMVTNVINHIPLNEPFDGLGNEIAACLFLVMPHLANHTKLTAGALRILLSLEWDLEGLINMVDYESIIHHLKCIVYQQPEEALLYLTKGIDDSQALKSRFIKSVIESVIDGATQTNISEISQPLMNTLLMFTATTHVACELLIKCMAFLYLPELIARLMKMAYTLDPRQNQVSKGLIAKALLIDKWAGESILLYVDMIRDFKYRKSFSTIFPGSHFTWRSTPADIEPTQAHILQENSANKLEDSDTDKYVMEFISVLGLWGEKAAPWALEAGLKQMVHKTCGSPLDQTNVLVWKTLSFAILGHRSLVWVVMQECSGVMKLQRRWIDDLQNDATTDDLFEKKLYAILTPMIILQALHPTVYECVNLNRQTAEEMKTHLVRCGNNLDNFKVSDDDDSKHSQLCAELLDALSIRLKLTPGLSAIENLSKMLTTKIFGKVSSIP